jgi:hypothetical protein
MMPMIYFTMVVHSLLEKAIGHQDNNPEVSLFYSLHFWTQVGDFDLPKTMPPFVLLEVFLLNQSCSTRTT